MLLLEDLLKFGDLLGLIDDVLLNALCLLSFGLLLVLQIFYLLNFLSFDHGCVVLQLQLD